MTPLTPVRTHDLPDRVVVGANGAYWRDFGDAYSMCPVSTDNDSVDVTAVYVRQPAGRGTCWFCKGEFLIGALIAGYDTFDEQRLACLACNERMIGNWRPVAPATAPKP